MDFYNPLSTIHNPQSNRFIDHHPQFSLKINVAIRPSSDYSRRFPGIKTPNAGIETSWSGIDELSHAIAGSLAGIENSFMDMHTPSLATDDPCAAMKNPFTPIIASCKSIAPLIERIMDIGKQTSPTGIETAARSSMNFGCDVQTRSSISSTALHT